VVITNGGGVYEFVEHFCALGGKCGWECVCVNRERDTRKLRKINK
jgi:hypothetical protein